MASNTDFTGKQIGNYQLMAELTRNFSIVVYLARHRFLEQRLAAVKLLHNPSQLEKKRELFFQEAHWLDLLKHPAILPLVDVGLFENLPYVMTEYAPNGSLKDRMDRQLPAPLPLEEALTILWQVGQAVQYMHDLAVVHCDLKPANILFNARGEALLADFGFAMQLSAPSLQQERGPGTLHYIAPEKFDGIINREGDQYGLGCIAYELVTGQRPFVDLSIRGVMLKHKTQAPLPPSQLNAQVPPQIEQAILKALAKSPADRHADVSAFLSALGLPTIAQLHPSTVSLPPAPSATLVDETEGEKTKEQWLDEASVHYEAGRFPAALAAYEAALLLDPAESYAYVGMGLVLCDLARYEEALTNFERAIERDPAESYAYVGMGLALRLLGRSEEALIAYQQAITYDPYDADAFLGKALVHSQMGHHEEALCAYEEVLERHTTHMTAWQGKGDVLQRLGRAQDAQRARERARQLAVIAAPAGQELGAPL